MTIKTLYFDGTGIIDPISATVSMSHSGSVTNAIVNCRDHSLGIGDSIDIDLGFTDNHDRIFRGYVKQLEKKVPDNTYIVTANDVLVRALDFFIVSTNPDAPFTRNNISAEDLVEDVLALAGLTNYVGQNSSFTFATQAPAEVNLVSSYDYCKAIADLLAYH